MKAKDVQIGQVYKIKVGANVTGVRITEENPYGGWGGININTNKAIRIRTASRIQGLWKHTTPTLAHVENNSDQPTDDIAAANEPNITKRGGLNAVVRVLQEAGQSLNCRTIVERMLQQEYWQTNGKTPQATINAAIAREIKTKGDNSRFRKVQRGLFALTK
ncbi:MAG: winged helix-turn-helix domain-containing protein [Sedimentisphaerales bacterium]